MKRRQNRSKKPNSSAVAGKIQEKPAHGADDAGLLDEANLLLGQGRTDEALALLQRAAQSQPPRPEALLTLGRLHMDRQEFAQAASIFWRLCEISPQDASLRNSLAMAQIMAGQPEAAQAHLEEAARLAPQEAVFHLNLGKYFILRQQFDRARQVLADLWTWVPVELRSDTLGCLNQALANLGQPPMSLDAPAPSAAPPAREDAPPAMDMLLCCGKSMDSFINGLIAGLAPRVRVEKLVSDQAQGFIDAIGRHHTVWIEWGNELAEFLTKEAAPALRGKRVVLRIHAYEVMQGLADRVDFSQVTDLMFVCAGMRDILLERRPEIRQQVPRIHVIPNGIDLERFTPRQFPVGQDIAYVGYLNFKKGPMVLMHALRHLRDRDGRCRLHVAGVFQDAYSETACRHFLARNGLESSVIFNGWVKDVQDWLKDKNAIICTSLSESQGLGLMEALAMGLKPLIYNFHTAEQIYPPQWLWNNFDELGDLLYRPHDPLEGRRFVEENYSLALQVQRLCQMLFEKREVVFEGPVAALSAPPPVPEQCFSQDLPQRLAANKDLGIRLKGQGWLKQAAVFLRRAWRQSGYRDLHAGQELLQCHQNLAQHDDMTAVYRELGLAAATRGDYELMLNAFHEVYYHVYRVTGSYRWQKFDPAIEAVLRLVAERIEPLPGHQELLPRLDPAKLKLALALDSFDPAWATVKRFVDIGKRLDKSRFEVIYLTRMEFQESWRPAWDELSAAGCHLLAEPGQEQLPKIQRFLYVLRAMGCDALMMNTQFLTPWYDLLALRGAARKVVKFNSQGGGLETSSDLVVSVLGRDLIDEVAPGAYIGPAYVSEVPRRRDDVARQPGRLRAVCVGRAVKFVNNPGFWEVLARVLNGLPGLEIDIVGLTAQEALGGAQFSHPRLKFLGFRRDVQAILATYDVLIDTWPAGGGCTIREAHACGLPVVSYPISWYEHFAASAAYSAGMDDLVHPELMLKQFDARQMGAVLGRLLDDPSYYMRIQRECRDLPVLTPQGFCDRLADELWRLCGR